MSHWKDLLDPEARGGRFLPWKEVGRATGLSRTTAWRLQKRGEFPAPYAISPGRVGYREDEVEAWRVSRDHSAARITRPVAATRSLPPAVVPPTTALESVNPGPMLSTGTPGDSAPVSPPVVARPQPGPPVAEVSARRGRAVRRRSQHAQAIAQQILFDF